MDIVDAQNVSSSRKGISGSALKMIALVTMLIDHFGATILGRMLYQRGMSQAYYAENPMDYTIWLEENATLYFTYRAMRLIGRIAFPILIFLMVEGLSKTHNRWKYLQRMVLFAFLSEVPFDLALTGQILEFTHQNIFGTMSIGLLAMILCERIEKDIRYKPVTWEKPLAVLLMGGVILAATALAEGLKVDYGWRGIVCIMAIYLFRKNKYNQIIAGCIAFLWESTAPFAFIPISFYNGKRGFKGKYIFYIFYPVHLLILYGISLVCGLGAYIAY